MASAAWHAARRIDAADTRSSRTPCSKLLQAQVATAGFLPAVFT
ncbi:hypothetical protein HMPREF1248_0556 [Coriobacteriaceae bacterium BV3Ac1]|nr:hypothetical protein [Olegusella massiliensis]ERL11689.1 hypothetical protein HMPREF1248_0556 [Coriobacteriaceae bacterium BV3Ac1]